MAGGRIRNSKFLALLKYFARAHIWMYRHTSRLPLVVCEPTPQHQVHDDRQR
jgi:hypothetical protein